MVNSTNFEDMENCDWARKLAAPFGFMPQKLFVCHSAVIAGVKEEFASGRPLGDEPSVKTEKTSKPGSGIKNQLRRWIRNSWN